MSKLLYTDFREEGIVIRLVREHVKLKKKTIAHFYYTAGCRTFITTAYPVYFYDTIR